MKEFLDNIYKQCATSKGDPSYEIMKVLPKLFSEKKFEIVDNIFNQIDLSRLNTSAMYSFINLSARYIHQLQEYRSLYQKVREEFARRNETSERISNLFDKFQNGFGINNEVYDPNETPYILPDVKDAQRLDAKINWAKEIGDKDLVTYLELYKSYSMRPEEKDAKFRKLSHDIGEDELRRRCIKSLRDMADLLETTTSYWPGIYYCDLPEDPLLKGTFIDGIEVTISYPWPG